VPLRSGGDLGVQQFMVAEFVQSIRQQLLDFELPTENVMTAYETRERANRILKLMSGLVGRINMEFITPFFAIGLRLLEKWEVISIPPEIGDINQFTTKILLHSPISRTQQMEDVENTRIAMEVLNLAQSPVAMQQVNMERFVRFVWESCGAPTRLLNDANEVREKTAEAIRNQAIAAQAQNMDLNKMGGTNEM
jgi:hypothetical protein